MATSADDVVTYTPVSGKPALLLGAFEIGDVGYVAEEFFVSGTASSYQAAGELGPDGRWSAEPAAAASYTTRIVTLTPKDASRFNGTVLVEWLNVSGGIDAPAVWMMAHREMLRSGYAYVAVSAQRVGVDGGETLTGMDMSLKSQNPHRYSSLEHPGDAYAYDIFAQAGQLARKPEILRGLRAEHVIAIGESQSAMFLTTYVNAVEPAGGVYDGFLVHSRFGPAAPLNGDSVFEVLESTSSPGIAFRPDLTVPLLTIITETDLFGARHQGYHSARQSDYQQLRVWEIAGTAHADNYTIQVAPIDTGTAPLADIVAAYAPTNMLMGAELDHCINFAPQHHYVLQAALSRLNDWVRTGQQAPHAAQIELDGDQPVLGEHGLVRGGIRTPWADVPIALTSGVGGDQTAMSPIFGSGEPFDAATVRRLYPGGRADYLERFTASLDATIEAGFLLSADRTEILEIAAATYPD
ncbi:alpha/beta hydrolase domain-containing protein [Candidatus Mycobacterium wuenschmannii]|uniref:Alpha/beta hydrolase domain-containing protein n=1 Tax=Candidatus Mycobacterium wuenschmannii TaxID=3027808 RepID=A0ABY8VVL6_9MYCO|nr:alpha/beta hydrolase domain-containing protein [Candidatus Mycobacterium wuenschmannii]WIM86819.1 alpha/beta hydrolase domain-containing protein [Candidatus Mycobacterium wuenschmannii]